MRAPASLEELEAALSDPTDAAVAAVGAVPGDLVVLGAGGKMGPSLARMARRAADRAGGTRRVFAVSRFSDPSTARALEAAGVETIAADLGDPAAWPALPDAPSVVYMVGQKFGTRDAPGRTWFTNTVVPAFAAARYRDARIVAFSTGNVYPLVPVDGGGSREGDALAPVGEYAMSCLGRERVFEHAAATWGTRSCLLRLNYAVDLRYGVLVDIALRVRDGAPVDLTMGWVNCIWQGDANAAALAMLTDAAAPVAIRNLTGTRTLRVRDVAVRFGEHFARRPVFTGDEGQIALLSNATPLATQLGPWRVNEGALIDWVASWISAGLPTSGKPTHFQETTGRF